MLERNDNKYLIISTGINEKPSGFSQSYCKNTKINLFLYGV